MAYYIKYINKYIKPFRYATEFDDLTVNELHAILNFFGVPISPKGNYDADKIEDLYHKTIDQRDDMLRKLKVFIKVKRWLKGKAPNRQEFEKWYKYAIETNRTPESIKEMKKTKNIFLTENQLNSILNEEKKWNIDPKKVLVVKNYLDKGFKRGNMCSVGENGQPKTTYIVAMLSPNGEVLKNMTSQQLFYLLQDRFSKIFSDKEKRDEFLKKVMIEWYNKKIKNNGMMSFNRF